MRTLDLSPLYRSAVGFDRMAGLLDTLSQTEQRQPNYPPYNIETTGDDQYRISMAVAGFDQSELAIEVNRNQLTISGNKKVDENSDRKYLHKGIAERNFDRHFQLADHVKVHSASLQNGLLHVDLVREIPEAAKPRNIAITVDSQSTIDDAQSRVA